MNRKPCITDYFFSSVGSRKQNVFMGRAMIEQRNASKIVSLPFLDKCNTIVPMRKREQLKDTIFKHSLTYPL